MRFGRISTPTSLKISSFHLPYFIIFHGD
jgi:hypothetical protein